MKSGLSSPAEFWSRISSVTEARALEAVASRKQIHEHYTGHQASLMRIRDKVFRTFWSWHFSGSNYGALLLSKQVVVNPSA